MLEILNTDKALDLICEITPAISSIIEDKEVQKIWKDRIDAKGMTEQEKAIKAEEKGRENIIKLIPLLLRKHREVIYKILSVFVNKSEEEIKQQPIIETIKQIKEIVKNEELMLFFQSLMN